MSTARYRITTLQRMHGNDVLARMGDALIRVEGKWCEVEDAHPDYLAAVQTIAVIEPSARRVGIAAKILSAAKGVKQAVVEPATQEVQEQRWAVCKACDLLTPCLVGQHCCGKLITGKGPDQPGCGCILEVKIRGGKQKCPLNKWNSTKPTEQAPNDASTTV